MLLSMSSMLHAQKFFNGRHEMGWVAGVSNYHGDITHGLTTKNFRPMGGMYYKYQLQAYP